MTTIIQTFDEDNKTGKTIGEVVTTIEGNTLTQSEKLAVTQWLYVNYRVTESIVIAPDATP